MQRTRTARAYECSLAAGFLLLTACSGQSLQSNPDNGFVTPKLAATCPPPSPGPAPLPAWLNYPPSGSTNISTRIGEIIAQGAAPGNGLAISVAGPVNSNVPVGTPYAAPSPYPTPFATAPPQNASYPYMAVPLPTLSPSTTYTVSDIYTDWSDDPPQCSAEYTQTIGTFTTGQSR